MTRTRSKKHHCHPTKASRIFMSCCRSHQRHKLRSSHILNLLGTGKRTPNSINRSYSSASVTSWLLSFSISYYQLLLQRTLRRAFRIPVPFPVLISLILPICHCHHSPALSSAPLPPSPTPVPFWQGSYPTPTSFIFSGHSSLRSPFCHLRESLQSTGSCRQHLAKWRRGTIK